MYTTILIPLDGSAVAESPLPYAGALARSVGTQLLLVRVVPPPGPIAPESGREADWARTGSESYLERVTRTIEPKAAASSVVIAGEPATAIADEARARGANLLRDAWTAEPVHRLPDGLALFH
jgi:nucleotide-binding universal stress UspA family protein